jgi:aromatic-L-amino-acid decarboxylase
MDINEFKKNAHDVVEWMANYLTNIEQFPVKSQVSPGFIKEQLPSVTPRTGESFGSIMRDLDEVIMPGITHWQHPMFYAYFPANSSPPSVLAEMITATMGLQCMLWETSPAATELEQRMMEWLRDMLGLPATFTGVIQDTASVSTMSALLAARERATQYRANTKGLLNGQPLAVYCSAEAHSSVDKAVRIIGLGHEYLRKIEVDENYAMRPECLERAIQLDRENGIQPMAIVASIGTTGCGAVDPLAAIGRIAQAFGVWLHVDAAYAGSALILPEMRWVIEGIDYADSFVMNPHKWLMVNFDCSALYVKDIESLERTFEIHPEYLKTARDGQVKDFRNYGIQLGRRFRALKLWMVMRSYGVEGLQSIIRNHIDYAQEVHAQLVSDPHFEILAPTHFSLVTFRYRPEGIDDEPELDRLNQELLARLNGTGELFMTHTKLRGRYALRLAIGQTNTTREHVTRALELIRETAQSLSK